jgi:type I restriction enzyme S subunit
MQRQSAIHLGDLFRSRRERGKPGLPVFSVTMGDGLVERETLERKTNGNLAPEEHLLIRKGDIAYNMMRMWQGASGLAKQDGIVSPAYVVVAPKKGIYPLFAAYWFKSARMIYLFWAYSYGITGDRLRLYYKDFARIPVSIPPYREQERIARIFVSSDRAIERLEKIVEAKRRLKTGLAEQLLTGESRLPGFGKPSGDGEVPIGWQQVKYKTIARFRGGIGFPEEDQGTTDGIPFIKVSDMGLPENSTYILRSNHSVTGELAFLRGWKPFPPGAVVFAKVGAALLLNRRRVLVKPTLIDNNMMERFHQSTRARSAICLWHCPLYPSRNALPRCSTSRTAKLRCYKKSSPHCAS